MKYRSEIDGLRALAVIPVIFYHAGFELFSGGFIGVDVFFVISGYLITTILITEIEAGTFSLINFYERRARRILPALFFIMFLCLPFAWTWLFNYQLNEFSRSLIAVSFFVSNIFFAFKGSYFTSETGDFPLLHTWSLAVEEQYYIIFPIFLLLTWRFGKNKIFYAIVIFAILSLILSEIGWRKRPTPNFYLTPMRAWELLAGSITAFLIQKNGIQKNNILALAGLGAILFSIFFYDDLTPFPSLYALVPVVGTIFIIKYGEQNTITAKILSHKFLVTIGLISYSAYLWHQPLFAFARLRNFGQIDFSITIILIVITFLAAYFTWKYIETPIRQKTVLKSRKSMFTFSITGLVGFVLIGLYGQYKTPDSVNRTPSFLRVYENQTDYISDNYFLLNEGWYLLRDIRSSEEHPLEVATADRALSFDLSDPRLKTLIVGNSHSIDFYNVLSFSKKASQALQLAQFSNQLSKIGDVFFASQDYKNSDIVIFCSRLYPSDINHLERLARQVINDKKKLLFCRNIFIWLEGVDYTKVDLEIISRLKNGESSEVIAKSINQKYQDDYLAANYFGIGDYGVLTKQTDEKLKALSESLNFEIIDRMSYVCPNGECQIVSERLGKYIFDSNGHHSVLGAEKFGTTIDDIGFIEDLIKE